MGENVQQVPKCPINGCVRPWDQVSDRAFVCKYHWKKLPKFMQGEVFRAERIGGKALSVAKHEAVMWLRAWDRGPRVDMRDESQKVRNRHTQRREF